MAKVIDHTAIDGDQEAIECNAIKYHVNALTQTGVKFWFDQTIFKHPANVSVAEILSGMADEVEQKIAAGEREG